jgi:hypothetical protein
MTARRFPAPWTIEELNDACFIVSDNEAPNSNPLASHTQILAGVALSTTVRDVYFPLVGPTEDRSSVRHPQKCLPQTCILWGRQGKAAGAPWRLCCLYMRAMEGIVKLRLLLTSTLFLFVQMISPAPQAQSVTVDVAKITCDQLFKEELPWTSTYIILWLSGY